jgi:hypothetical protein
MVAKCANPDCNREFRELSKGRLFVLPPVYGFAESMSRVQRLIDHCHWLCPECAATCTLTLEGNNPVVKVVNKFQPTSMVKTAAAGRVA